MPRTKADAPPSYDAASITELGFPEAIQRRPGMYIGGRSNLHHLVAEVIDNAIDEAMGGHCTVIEVTLEADGSATVVDNGRGVYDSIFGTATERWRRTRPPTVRRTTAQEEVR